ncbi:hypothetical protein ASD50_21990 [Mesorhizobium sp. Root552]|nr:hypothetical protein ASD50_21990 [Mesorhizobium sp. Root552]
MITSAQIGAACALLGWKQIDVAAVAGISEMSVKNIGRGVTNPRVNRPTAIRTAHEAAGVIFIDQNGGGPGVRLRKAQTSLG